MRSSGSKFIDERKGIICGAAISISLFISLIPSVVQAQTLPEELDVPLRPQMQLPICGKIEPVAATTTRGAAAAPVTKPVKVQSAYAAPLPGAAESSTGHAKTVSYPLEVTPITSSQTSINKVAKLPVGTFNQTQHVKEFSWLPEDSTVEIEEPVASKESKSSTAAKAAKSTKDPKAASKKADSEESPVEPSSKSATVESSSKPKSTQVAGASKEHKIDPDAVKTARKPHCSGVADYYADQFHGRKTASGQLHDREKFTAAHRTLPFGSKLKVVNRNTGKACIVTVNDRGPFTKNKIIDLSCAAARELGLLTAKSRLVDCYLVENE